MSGIVEIRDEITLPRRVVPQPTPNLNNGGDCVACCVAGVTGLSVEEVYAIAKDAARTSEEWRWKTGYCALDDAQVIAVLAEAKRRGLVHRWIDEVPIWPWEVPGAMARSFLTFGLPGHMQFSGWLGYIRLALEAGYYALGGVDSARGGPTEQSDHWVTICGARQRWTLNDDGLGSGRDEVLISCSSRATPDEEWVPAGDVLSKRGMFAVLLVKPKA